jgi:hypothetical protein
MTPAIALCIVTTIFGYMPIPSSWYNAFFRPEIGGRMILENV